MKKVLITGMAGFIGYHLAKLLSKHYRVVGIDNINEYYDVNLKYARLQNLGFKKDELSTEKLVTKGSVSFQKIDLINFNELKELFKTQKFDYVVNLAAQAGVRYSLVNPHTYISSNITGFLNVLECCRAYPVKHLIFASSSSVYGLSEQVPFTESNGTDHPLSLYAATKKANEMMAHSYANLYNIPCTGLRFFTVYGPMGRPDMAPHLFTEAIYNNKEINVFNHGNMSRDFTYVKDIAESMRLLLPLPPKGNPEFNPTQPTPETSSKPYQIFNIGNNNPVPLMDFISTIENELGKRAKITFKPMQPGDVPNTYANVNSLFNYINFKPKTPLKEGVRAFISTYLKMNI